MQKVTMSFELPEDQESLDNALNGYKYRIAADEFLNYMRSLAKYDSDRVSTLDPLELVDEIRAKAWELLSERD